MQMAPTESFQNASEFTAFQRLISRFTTPHRSPWEKYSRACLLQILYHVMGMVWIQNTVSAWRTTQLARVFTRSSRAAWCTPGSALGTRGDRGGSCPLGAAGPAGGKRWAMPTQLSTGQVQHAQSRPVLHSSGCQCGSSKPTHHRLLQISTDAWECTAHSS